MNRPLKKSSIRLAGVSLILTGASLLSGGCDTLASDLGDMVENMTPKSPSEVGRMAIDPHDADNRRRGATLLANAYFGGGEPYLEMYREYAQHDPDPLVRAAAVRALARHGGPEDAPIIAAQLKLGDSSATPAVLPQPTVVRQEAAKGLQRLHDPAVIPVLLDALREDEDRIVRAAAADALGQYPQDRVFNGLVAALNARELSVNVTARKSLTTITGEDFGFDDAAWLRWHRQALANGSAYAKARAYLFPTFQRDERWWEKLAFWTTRGYEEPAPPAGLKPESARSTYDETDNDADSSPEGG